VPDVRRQVGGVTAVLAALCGGVTALVALFVDTICKRRRFDADLETWRPVRDRAAEVDALLETAERTVAAEHRRLMREGWAWWR
jgi:hypothetical protein